MNLLKPVIVALFLIVPGSFVFLGIALFIKKVKR